LANYFSQLRGLPAARRAGIQAITIRTACFQTYRREVDFYNATFRAACPPQILKTLGERFGVNHREHFLARLCQDACDLAKQFRAAGPT
jgi:hypothetical protein